MDKRPRGGAGRSLLRTLVISGLMLCAGILLADDLDSLFTDSGGSTTDNSSGGNTTPPPHDGGNGAATTPAIRPDDISRDTKLHYFASLNIYGLFGLGWSQLPPANDLYDGLGAEGSGSLSASLGIDLRPTPELRLRGTTSYSFPGAGSQLSELIVDYSIRNSVFFKLGIFDYTWGSSQFFQFSNLPSRGLPSWGISNQPLWQKANIISNIAPTNFPASVRVYVPFGVSGITFLARFDMQNYGFPGTPPAPDPRQAGYGLQLDLVTGPIQWTLAGFYQRLLTPRAALALKTSILGFDVSVESTMAFPVALNNDGLLPIETTGGGIFVGGVMQRIYPTAVVGVGREWVDARIKLYAEYAFNGERDSGDPSPGWLQDESGPGGHNSAVALRFAKLGLSEISLNMLWQHNWSDGSGLVSSFFEVSPVPLTTIQLGPVFVYGHENNEVMNHRLVPGGKQLELLLLVKVTADYRQ